MPNLTGRKPYERVGKVVDIARRRRWNLTHTHCQSCGHPGNVWGRWLETNHIIRGSMRSDEETNFLRLCKLCHDRASGLQVPGHKTLTLANCLWLKRECDPAEYDEARLTALYGQTLPTPEKP